MSKRPDQTILLTFDLRCSCGGDFIPLAVVLSFKNTIIKYKCELCGNGATKTVGRYYDLKLSRTRGEGGLSIIGYEAIGIPEIPIEAEESVDMPEISRAIDIAERVESMENPKGVNYFSLGRYMEGDYRLVDDTLDKTIGTDKCLAKKWERCMKDE